MVSRAAPHAPSRADGGARAVTKTGERTSTADSMTHAPNSLSACSKRKVTLLAAREVAARVREYGRGTADPERHCKLATREGRAARVSCAPRRTLETAVDDSRWEHAAHTVWTRVSNGVSDARNPRKHAPSTRYLLGNTPSASRPGCVVTVLTHWRCPCDGFCAKYSWRDHAECTPAQCCAYAGLVLASAPIRSAPQAHCVPFDRA